MLYQDTDTHSLSFINYGEPSPRSIQIQFENADQCQSVLRSLESEQVDAVDTTKFAVSLLCKKRLSVLLVSSQG